MIITNVFSVAFASLSALAAVSWAGTATAQDTIILKLAETSPASHYIATEGSQFFMKKAKELSGGKLDFEYYPAQQLGKAQDMIRIAVSGVADISYVPVGQLADQLPLSGARRTARSIRDRL